jgi:hypothetical protein
MADMTEHPVWAWVMSNPCFYLFATLLLLLVLLPMFQNSGPEEMMIDRLYGGAAAYLLLRLLWCYFYVIREHFSPGSLSGIDSSKPLQIADLVFFSFGSLTTAGGGGFVPPGESSADAGAPGRTGRNAVHGGFRREACINVFERAPMT